MVGEAVHESEVSHIIAVPQIPPPAHWPSLSGCYGTAGLAATTGEAGPWAARKSLAPQELGTAPGFAPGWLGLGSCFHGSCGTVAQGAGYTGCGIGADFVGSMCGGEIACVGFHGLQLTHQLGNFSKAGTRYDPSLGAIPNTKWALG